VTGKCIGTLLSVEENIPLISQCHQLCKEQKYCKWISYNSVESACNLLEDCFNLDETDEEYLSAERRCDEVFETITVEKTKTSTSVVTTTTPLVKGNYKQMHKSLYILF